MKISKILFSIAFTYAISGATLQGNCVLPVKISPAVVDGAGNDACPPQGSIHAQLNATKEEIRQAVLDTINPILNQNSTTSHQCGGSGWTTVVFLNMTNLNEVCPSNLSLLNSPVEAVDVKQLKDFRVIQSFFRYMYKAILKYVEELLHTKKKQQMLFITQLILAILV